MAKFDRLLSEAIDSLEETDVDEAASTLSLLDEIKIAEDHLKELKDQLSSKVEDLCAAMSGELKKLLPKVDAKLSNGSCIFTYFARTIGVKPNVNDGVWEVEQGSSSRDRSLIKKFMSEWNNTPLGDWKELTRALAETFVGKYKTLQGGNIDLPKEEEEELSDEAIDTAIDNVGATAPLSVNSRAVDRKGTSKTPGGSQYV